MALEDLTGSNKFLSALVPANPAQGDIVGEGDDHIRGIKNVLLNTFGPLEGPFEPDPMPAIRAAMVGMQAAFIAPALPLGWVLCDGRTIDSTTYPELVELLNPGGTEALIPDLRGRFVRGWSDDATVDPDGPRAAGTAQADGFAAHTHPPEAATYFVTYGGGAGSAGGGSSVYSTMTATGSAGGAETRPVNVAVWFAIYGGR